MSRFTTPYHGCDGCGVQCWASTGRSRGIECGVPDDAAPKKSPQRAANRRPRVATQEFARRFKVAANRKGSSEYAAKVGRRVVSPRCGNPVGVQPKRANTFRVLNADFECSADDQRACKPSSQEPARGRFRPTGPSPIVPKRRFRSRNSAYGSHFHDWATFPGGGTQVRKVSLGAVPNAAL